MGSGVNTAEFTVVTKSGRRVLIEATGNLIVDADGKANGLVVVERDVTERKSIEEALRESETKLKSVIQGSPIPQFVIDKNHKVLYWNKAMEEISGIKSVDVLETNKHWQAFYAKERACLADLLVNEKTECIPELYKGKYNESKYTEGAYEAENFFPLIGNEGKWLFFGAAPIRDAQGNIIGAIETLEDITERKNAEDALRQEQLFSKSALDNLPEIFYLFTYPEKRLKLTNKQVETLLGFNAEEINGR